jgi:hypothetical protein
MAEIQSLSQIFGNILLRIPDYQRGYSWGESEIEALWRDLERARTQKRTHFTGVITVNKFSNDDFQNLLSEGIKEENIITESNSLVMNREEYKLYNVVDGQQRFTTILILLFCLINKLNDKEKQERLLKKYFRKETENKNHYFFGYHIDVPSRNYLLNNIFEEKKYQENQDVETLYTHNLQDAKAYFLDKIDKFSTNAIEDCIYTIENRLKFFMLILDEEVDISMVFETMNFRGKQLSGLERFKNRVLYLLSHNKKINEELKANRRKEVNDVWLEIYRWLGKGGESKLTDDEFLKAFWIIQFSGESMIDKDFKAYQKQIFETDFKAEESSHIGIDMIWLQNMKKAISLWYFINNPYDVNDDKEFNFQYTKTIQRSLYRIAHFPKGLGKYMQTLILALLMRLLPKNDEYIEPENNPLEWIEKLLWHIERHNIICFLFYGNNTRFNREHIFRFSSLFYNKKRSIEHLILELNRGWTKHFSWNVVVKNIRNTVEFWHGWDGINFILREYEESLSGRIVPNNEANVRFIYPTENDIHRRSYQQINRSQLRNRNVYTYSLGNLLITKGNTTSKDFKSIKDDIRKSTRSIIYQSEQEILEYSDWTTDTITERGKKILDTILEKWKIDKPKEREYDELFKA